MTVEIVGTAQICFGGVAHAIDRHGVPFCKTTAPLGRLFNDEFPTVVLRDSITCKRCLSLIDRSGG
jgi:hypothetical protein